MMAIKSGNLSVHEVANDKELYDLWPNIRNGIKTVDKRCKSIFYRPEDVYHEIKTGTAKLLVGTIEEEYQGFFILKIIQYPDGPWLHIWIAHNAGADGNFIHNFVKAIDRIATLLGVIRISYTSSRKGWKKACKKHGFKQITGIHYYEREVRP